MKFSCTSIPRNVISAVCAALLFTMPFGVAAAEEIVASKSNDEKIEEVLVLANHLPSNASNVGSSVSSINTNDFARQANFDVSQLLRTLPNMSVNRAGPLGALTQVRIRGAERAGDDGERVRRTDGRRTYVRATRRIPAHLVPKKRGVPTTTVALS